MPAHVPGRRGLLARYLSLALSIVLLAGPGSLPHAEASLPADGAPRLIDIDAATPQERTWLVSLGIDVVNADMTGLMAWATPTQLAEIERAGFTYREIGTVSAAGLVDPDFHTFDELVAELELVAATYPHITWLTTAGESLEGRPIYALKISDNPSLDEDEPEALLFALTHAREHLTVEMALYIIEFLTKEYGQDGAITNLVNQREIWILPNVNPDGDVYDTESGYYRSWRKNRRVNADGSFGVDLNRNYGYLWGCCGGSSGMPSEHNYRGPAPFSEPESGAIRDFVVAHPHITASISFHTYSELVLWPYGYTYEALPANMDPLDYQAFAAVGGRMAELNGYKAHQASQLYLTDGSSDDWMYGERGIFAFTFEMYPTSYSPGFYPPGSVIDRETTRNRAAVEYFLGIADNPRKTVSPEGDTAPPAITLDGPADGAYVQGELLVTADASDNVAVTLVEFIANGETVTLDAEPPYVMQWEGQPGLGVVTLKARAFDAGHNVTGSDPLTLHLTGMPALRLPLFYRSYVNVQ